MSKTVFLKVKLKSLAEESRIISAEERRMQDRLKRARQREDLEAAKKAAGLWSGLESHRKAVVRREARATGLAYAFLRGKSYRTIEPHTKTTPDWQSVTRMVFKYGNGDNMTRAWQVESSEQVGKWGAEPETSPATLAQVP